MTMRHVALFCMFGFLGSGVTAGEELPPAQRARLLRLNGEPHQGITLLEPIVSKPAAPPDAIEEFILCTTSTVSDAELKDVVEQIEKRFGEQPAFFVLRSNMQEVGGDRKAAVDEVEKGLLKFPESLLLLTRKGQLLVQRIPDQGVAYLENLQKAHPESDRVAFVLAKAYQSRASVSLEFRQKALEAYEAAARLAAGWAQPLLEAGRLLMELEQPQRAFETFVRAESIAPANLIFKLEKYNAALQTEPLAMTPRAMADEIEKILGAGPRDQRTLEFAWRGYSLMEDEAGAGRIGAELAEKFPDSPIAVRTGMQRLDELAGSGKIAEAVALALASARRSTNLTTAGRYYEGVAKLQSELGAADELAPVLDEWAARFEKADPPEAAPAFADVASYQLTIDKSDKAATLALRARKIIEAVPATDPRVQPGLREYVLDSTCDTLARSLYDLGRFAEAKPYLEELQQAETGDPMWSAMLGDIAYKEAEWEPARYYLEEAFKLSYMKPEIEQRLKSLYVGKTGAESGWGEHLAALKTRTIAELKKDVVALYAADLAPLPELDLEVYGGGSKVSAASLRGRVVVLNVWATWCGPCRQELPELQKLVQAQAGKADVSIWAVNAEESAEEIKAFFANTGLRLPVLMDPNPWERFGIDAIPATIIADAQGRIRFAMTGFDTNMDYGLAMSWLIEAAREPAPGAKR